MIFSKNMVICWPGFATLILLSFSITWKDGKGGHELAGGGEQIAWGGIKWTSCYVWSICFL